MRANRPSENEEEYFARKEYERLKELVQKTREEDEAKKREEQKQLHYMHCPKCGGDLAEIVFQGVHVDKCTSCEGVWLDAGELEEILKKEDESMVKRILNVFI